MIYRKSSQAPCIHRCHRKCDGFASRPLQSTLNRRFWCWDLCQGGDFRVLYLCVLNLSYEDIPLPTGFGTKKWKPLVNWRFFWSFGSKTNCLFPHIPSPCKFLCLIWVPATAGRCGGGWFRYAVLFLAPVPYRQPQMWFPSCLSELGLGYNFYRVDLVSLEVQGQSDFAKRPLAQSFLVQNFKLRDAFEVKLFRNFIHLEIWFYFNYNSLILPVDFYCLYLSISPSFLFPFFNNQSTNLYRGSVENVNIIDRNYCSP